MDGAATGYETLLYEKTGQVALVTLNRPERLNAMSAQLRDEMHRLIGQVREDDEVRVLVITGAGRGFCSGADVGGGQGTGGPPSQNDRLDELMWMGRWAKLFHDFDKPMVAAVNGVAAGGGLGMALACDVRIGTENSRFKTSFVDRAVSADSGSSYFLPRIVGFAHAADLLLSSRIVLADEALRMGLLNRIVPADKLMEEAMAYAEQIAQWPPLSLRACKRTLQYGADAGFEEAIRYERVGVEFAIRAVNDLRESQAAFMEKRKGVFTGT
ncbi:MAG: enoyl-CoA hydratase-related protein [Phenylobacterium sp.]